MDIHSRDFIELEATLVVCSEQPDTIMRRIAEITIVDEYRLAPGTEQRIHDTYFDTADRSLNTGHWALRVREIDGNNWIALKGPPRSVDAGGVERMERDLPWSGTALQEVMGELSAHGLNPGVRVEISASPSTQEALLELGFLIIQDRSTRRQIRDIIFNGERVAEMDLDTVAYHICTTAILHEEIEIEAKAPSGSRAIRVILDHLLREFGRDVRKWDFGKLATGVTLERLLKEDFAEGLVGLDGHLTPAAYDKLESWMK
jgi:hypothetical protein